MVEAISTILDFFLNTEISSRNLESAKYFLARYHYKSYPGPVTIFFFPFSSFQGAETRAKYLKYKI